MKANVQKYADIALLCEEWWEITHDNNINYLDRLFKDDNVRRSVRQGIILQVISITLCYSITSERSTQQAITKPNTLLPSGVSELFKNLLFYTHQNFLVLIDLIINRLPPDSVHNIWAHSLQAILLNKSSKKLLKSTTSKSETAASVLISQNDLISEIIGS